MEQNLAQIEIKDIQDAKLMSQVNIFDNNFHLYLLVYVYLLRRKNFLFNVKFLYRLTLCRPFQRVIK
jgi:hypothetical protein